MLQLLLGALNVSLKAPVWLQIVHLLVTSLIWILLVLLAAAALGQPEPASKTSVEAASPGLSTPMA